MTSMKIYLSFIILMTGLVTLFCSDDIYAAENEINRMYGNDRYATAINIAASGWPQGAETIILVRGDEYADALTGATLAYQLEAPILLTPSTELLTSIKNEMIRLGASRVIILGGEVAVAAEVEQELKAMDMQVDRIAGQNRFDTAVKIMDYLVGHIEHEEIANHPSGQVIIVDGYNYADALSVAPYAASQQIPILLSESNKLPQEIAEVIDQFDQTLVIGGEVAISKEVFSLLPRPERIAGVNRFETSVKVADELFSDFNQVYIATGLGFADALTGSLLAARDQAPILLVRQDRLPDSVLSSLDSRMLDDMHILGGTTAVSRIVELSLYYMIDKVDLQQRAFSSQHQYFEVLEQDLPVYRNHSGTLIPIGSLPKGHQYPRNQDHGDYHKVRFGTQDGYVWKWATQPADGSMVRNKNNQTPLPLTLTTTKWTNIFDNTSGQLVSFAQVDKQTDLPILGDYGQWLRIEMMGLEGYVRKSKGDVEQKRIVNPRQSYTYDQMQQDIELLNIMYPQLIQTINIGRSVDGRLLQAIRLGTGAVEISLNGSHHAREHMTTNVLMNMIDEYAYRANRKESYAGYQVANLLEQTSMWFIPMSNPDGVTLVQKGHQSANNPQEVLRLNNNSTNFNAWKANIRGVDLNRQYPANWTNIRNDPGRAGPQNYKGPRPLSEPETKAIYDFTQSREFKSVAAYHSSGEIIFWYFNQTGAQLERDHNIVNQLGRITTYWPVTPSLNPSGGGYKDWFVQEYGQPGFTVEISPPVGPRPVPLSNYNKIWEQNRTVGLFLAEEAYRNRHNR